MTTFRPGQRVRYTGRSVDYVTRAHVGKLATVRTHEDDSVEITFDDGSADGVLPENLEPYFNPEDPT
jgi:hypothetical protein